jgi:hypothetical protein
MRIFFVSTLAQACLAFVYVQLTCILLYVSLQTYTIVRDTIHVRVRRRGANQHRISNYLTPESVVYFGPVGPKSSQGLTVISCHIYCTKSANQGKKETDPRPWLLAKFTVARWGNIADWLRNSWSLERYGVHGFTRRVQCPHTCIHTHVVHAYISIQLTYNIHIHAHTYTHPFTHSHTHTHMHTYMHTHTYTHTRTHM